MKKLLLYLLLLPALVFGQVDKKHIFYLFADTASSSTPPAVDPTPADFYRATITVADGSANAFIFTPEGLENPPSGGWPLIIHFNGDGTSNNTTNVVTAQAMTTGDNLTYVHTRTASLFRIMSSSVRIKVNGVEVARSYPGGTITGTGVTGTITNFNAAAPGTTTTPTISVTFSSSQSGNTITYDMVESTMFGEGPTRYINLGDDLDNKAILIAVQNITNTADFERDYWDNTVTYAWNNFTINPKRISAAGISRGGRQIIDQFANGANTSVLKTRYQFWIKRDDGAIVTSDPSNETTHATSGLASLVVGTASYAGSFTVGNITDIGQLIVHGTSDGTLTNNTPTYAATLSSANEPPYIFNVPGGFHTYEVWDTELYNRLWRPDDTGTARFDWLDFLLKYSKDQLERATLFVEQAERRRYNTEKDIIDYRHAARQVAALGASAEKTALEGRLTTLKSAIDGAGTRWVINFHSSGLTAGGNYKDVATDANSTTTSNIADFDGNVSGLDLVESTSPGSGMAVVGSDRRSHSGGLSLVANNSGITLTGWPVGTFNFTDIPSGTYTIRLYVNNGVADFSVGQQAAVTINSVEKDAYAAINTAIGYIEFTGLAHTSLSSNWTAYTYSGSPKLTMIELYKHP